MFAGSDIPEASWDGRMIYRTDRQVLQVYRLNTGAYEDVTSGELGMLTFVGPTIPMSISVGDLWFDSANANRLYRAASIAADEIVDGEWELVSDPVAAAQAAAAAQVAQGGTVTGGYQFGEISITADQGITVGGVTIPSDGSTPLVTANLETDDLTVNDNLSVLGPNNRVAGTLTLSSVPSAPTAKPQVFSSWGYSVQKVGTDLANRIGFNRGLADAGVNWLYTEGFYGGNIWALNKFSGVSTLLKVMPAYKTPTGVTKMGTSYYAVVSDYAFGGNWYVWEFDSSWNKTNAWYLANYSVLTHPAITNDGTNLLIAYGFYSGSTTWRLRVARMNTSGTITGIAQSSDSWNANVTGYYYGSADFGVNRHVMFWDGGLRCYTASFPAMPTVGTLTRQSQDEWEPANGESIQGGSWDGTRFHTLSSTSLVWRYSTNISTSSRSYTYTWADTTGTPHETPASPSTSFSAGLRQWTVVRTPVPADQGGADDPNAIGVYINNHLQGYSTTPSNSLVIDGYDFTGAGAPTSNNFTSATGLSQGAIISGNSPETVRINGDGSGFAGPDRWTATGADYYGGSQGLTPNSPYTIPSSPPFDDNCVVEKRKNTVWISGYIVRTDAATFAANTTLTNVITVPVGYRPLRPQEAQLPGEGADSPVRGIISTSGQVTLVTGSNPPSRISLTGFRPWFVN